jgi:tol-pal system protein YbgF
MRLYLVITGGLALCAGPLFAQDYIDLEAERVQQQKAAQLGEPLDPASEAAEPVTTTSVEPTPVETSQGSVSGALYYKLQLLEQEVMELRGQMEEQGHELRQLKQQSLERYVDIDRRLSGGASAESVSQSGATTTSTSSTTSTELAEQPGEADAYRSAYSLVRSQQFNEAVTSFRQFLQDYPAGKFAPNAHYWLGELFLVIVPPDLESSRREFTLLLEQYPNNSKIPDALYKLGKVYFDKGNPEQAREYLDRVVKEYGNSGSSAVKLARDFISQNY